MDKSLTRKLVKIAGRTSCSNTRRVSFAFVLNQFFTTSVALAVKHHDHETPISRWQFSGSRVKRAGEPRLIAVPLPFILSSFAPFRQRGDHLFRWSLWVRTRRRRNKTLTRVKQPRDQHRPDSFIRRITICLSSRTCIQLNWSLRQFDAVTGSVLCVVFSAKSSNRRDARAC